MNERAGGWDFLTHHARVLFVIARENAPRLRDIAAACDITERTAQNIVTDLEQAGYLRRERDGRRTRYTLCLNGALRHPADAHVPIAELVDLFAPTTTTAEVTSDCSRYSARRRASRRDDKALHPARGREIV
ncbi:MULTISPECIES: helix-turn-helix domain-containing protein [unclassified Streptomyces]|uniref:MarR family transcriptional regulator n=1 Tax=unclassified Streptomyces TaxID=2593676 RepID=UPI0033A2999D